MRSLCSVLLTGMVWMWASGCNLSDLTDASNALEGEMINPDVVESVEGARWIYLGAVARFNDMLAFQANQVARFTDEVAIVSTKAQGTLDSRVDPERPFVTADVSRVQSTRVQIEQAIQLLQEYYTGSNRTMEAHLYGLLGMVHLTLAENFCSGIPLSKAKWGGEFTPTQGYPTDSIYQRAVDLFDLGLTLNTDSTAVQTLLRVGKARALNALGRHEEAAAAVAEVATGDSVWISYSARRPIETTIKYFPLYLQVPVLDTLSYRVLNGKGQNGLAWAADEPSQQDMRVPLRIFDTTYANGVRDTLYRTPIKPRFFFTDRTVQLAGGAEARLIEAEAALATRDIPTFIAKINVVRRMYTTYARTPLADTTDPGTEAGRVDLLFRERAYTFYQTGRRLGDYRRLVRQYGRAPDEVYPIGRSEGSQFLFYGSNYVFAPEIPGLGRESQYNPYYYECESYAP